MAQTLDAHDPLLAAHAALRPLAERHGAASALAELDAAAERLRGATFRLAVLGEFKRGKSTLINALLGAPVLPMGVVPLTAIVTEVRHGAEPGAEIEFLDRTARTIAPAELPAYVTEPGNPRNEKRVRRAVVRHPAPLLDEGVVIYDTPGVGSVLRHNSEMTYAFLAEADAVVLVLAADQPASADERELLGALAAVTDRILCAVNRVDLLSAEDTALSVRFIADALAAINPHLAAGVHPISARRAFEASAAGAPAPEEFERFARALRRLLVDERAGALADRARRLTIRAADLIALRLEAERHARGLRREDLERAVAALQRAGQEAERRLADSEHLLALDVRRLVEVEWAREAASAGSAIAARLWPGIVTALAAPGREGLGHRTDRLSREIGAWVVEALRRLARDVEPAMHAGLGRALESHASRIEEWAAEYLDLANRLLGMHACVPAAETQLPGPARLHLRDWDYAGGQLRGARWPLALPRAWAEPHARRLLRELLERRIEQNLGAIRQDWTTRMEAALRAVGAASRERALALTQVVTEALRRATAMRDDREAAEAIEALDRDLACIGKVRERLAASSSGRAADAH
jgi:GTP-binding protein EngB required for normal cell division